MAAVIKGSTRDAGYFAVLVTATFLMASSFIAGKILLAAGVATFLLIGGRFCLAAVATPPLIVAAKSMPWRVTLLLRLSICGWGVVALIGFLQTAAVVGLPFLAMQTILATTAAILLFTIRSGWR